jgi:voltage-gated potassium channel
VAAGLMLAGIALVGVVTASFATWLLDKVRQVEEEAQLATRHDVAALATEIAALRAEIKAQKSASAPESSRAP